MRALIKETITRLKAIKLGLIPFNEDEGIYHFKIQNGVSEAETLSKMSEFEANGFFYQGISTMVGKDGFMVFCRTQSAAPLSIAGRNDQGN